MSDEYQDGCMIASQVIAALQLAIERYGDLPVIYTDDQWGDSRIRFISLERERILISEWDTGSEIITRVKKIGEAL